MHVVNGKENPVAYVSRTLSLAKVNYVHIERKALAIIYGSINTCTGMILFWQQIT